MSTRLEDIEAEAMKLGPEDRARLANRLLASLSGDSATEDAWGEEVDRRIAEIESGHVTMFPAADVIARARAALK